MGSHSLQAVALTVFLLAFIVLCAGFALGGNVTLVVLGLALVAGSGWVFIRCRQLEEPRS